MPTLQCSADVRHATDHYGNTVGSTKCPTLHEQMRKHPEFGASVEQFEQNKVTIKRQALELACPLLVADEVARGNYSENDLKCLRRTQMKKVAVAGDGHQYDLVRIKQYIRKHIGQRLVDAMTSAECRSQTHQWPQGTKMCVLGASKQTTHNLFSEGLESSLQQLSLPEQSLPSAMHLQSVMKHYGGERVQFFSFLMAQAKDISANDHSGGSSGGVQPHAAATKAAA